MNEENKNILTIKQFSLRTGLSIKVVRRLIKDNKLVYIKRCNVFILTMKNQCSYFGINESGCYI